MKNNALKSTSMEFEMDDENTPIISVSEEEKQYRKRVLARIEDVERLELNCTGCGKDVSDDCFIRNNLRLHPILHVIICKSCQRFYGTGEFSSDEDGTDKYCRWCGEGGSICLCNDCPRGFCKKCVKRNVKRSLYKKIQEDDHWRCFVCDVKQIWNLRALAAVAKDHLEKKKSKYEKSGSEDTTMDVDQKENETPRDGMSLSRQECVENDEDADVEVCENTPLTPLVTSLSKDTMLRNISPLYPSQQTVEDLPQEEEGEMKKVTASLEESIKIFENILNWLKKKREKIYVENRVNSMKVKEVKRLNTFLKGFKDMAVLNSMLLELDTFSDCGSDCVFVNNVDCGQGEDIESEISADSSTKVPEDSSTGAQMDFPANFLQDSHTDIPKDSSANVLMTGSAENFQFSLISSDEESTTPAVKESSSKMKRDVSKVKKIANDEENVFNSSGDEVACESETKDTSISKTKGSETSDLPVIDCEKISAENEMEEDISKAKASLLAAIVDSSSNEMSSSEEDGDKGDKDGKRKEGFPMWRSTPITEEEKKNRRLNLSLSRKKKESKGSNSDDDIRRLSNIKSLDATVKSGNSGGRSKEMTKKKDSCEKEIENKKSLLELVTTSSNDSDSGEEREYSPNLLKSPKGGGNASGSAIKDILWVSSGSDDESKVNSDANADGEEDGAGKQQRKKRETLEGSKEVGKVNEEEKKDENSDSSSASDLDVKRRKSVWRRDPLLKKLNFSSSSEGGDDDDNEKTMMKGKEGKGKSASILVPSSSSSVGEEEEEDEMECFKSKDEKKKRNKRKRSTKESNTERSSEQESSSDDCTIMETKEKKRQYKRLKRIANSDEGEGSDIEEGEEGSQNLSQSSQGKGRKNIRKILTEEELEETTRKMRKEEEERRKRVAERQALFNASFNPNMLLDAETTENLVLDFDVETKKEIISVEPVLVKKLKKHQVQGVKFMWDACFESVERVKQGEGGGCILAHCMGLGKTLQVITLVHTLLNYKEETGVKLVLIMCPKTTILNWVSEFRHWLRDVPNNDISVYHILNDKQDASKRERLRSWELNGGVMLVNYETFRTMATERKGRKPEIWKVFKRSLLNPGPDLIVCDEGHMLKNHKSMTTRATTAISGKRRIVLTGTPLQNHLMEYHCMVEFVKGNLLGTRKEFKQNFEDPICNGQFADSSIKDVKLMKKRAHILTRLLDGVVQRYDYTVLSPYLPPKFEYVICLGLSDLQAKLYTHYLENNSDLEDALLRKRLLADQKRLQMVCAHPYAMRETEILRERTARSDWDSELDEVGSLKDFIDDDDSDSGDSVSSKASSVVSNVGNRITRAAAKKDGNLKVGEENLGNENGGGTGYTKCWWNKLLSESDFDDPRHGPKLMVLLEILRQCEEIGDKVLVFSQSIPTLNMIEYFLRKIDEMTEEEGKEVGLQKFSGSWVRGLDYYRIDGSTLTRDREVYVKSFNKPNNARMRLFLFTTKTGGLGINVVAANRVVLFDCSWNPSHDIQSIFRVYRFGQTKPCYIYRFLAQGTMEEKMYEKQVTKLSMASRVVDKQQVDRHFTQSEINQMYIYDRKEKGENEVLKFPKDLLLAELLSKFKTTIISYHEHDSLLENVLDENLTEEEKKEAWKDWETEKTTGTRVQHTDPTLTLQIYENLKKSFPNLDNDELNLRVRHIENVVKQERQRQYMEYMESLRQYKLRTAHFAGNDPHTQQHQQYVAFMQQNKAQQYRNAVRLQEIVRGNGINGEE